MAVESGIESAPAAVSRHTRGLPVETGAAGVLIGLIVWLAVALPAFRTGANVSVILSQSAEIAVIAAGMTLVIATGGIDISVGSIVGLCGIVFGKLCVEHGWSLWSACLAALAVGASCGAVNGVLVSRFRLPPIIATLAAFSAARAGAYVLSHAESIAGFPDAMSVLGYENRLGIPLTAWVAAACLIGAGILLKRTTFGRGVLALGGNRQAAELSGLPVKRIELLVYTLSGLFAGIAALVVTARASTATPDAGKLFELRAITGVVLGGTPVIGGSGTMVGTALGVLTTGVIANGVRGYGKDDLWGQLVLGIALLAAVEIDRVRRARAARVKVG